MLYLCVVDEGELRQQISELQELRQQGLRRLQAAHVYYRLKASREDERLHRHHLGDVVNHLQVRAASYTIMLSYQTSSTQQCLERTKQRHSVGHISPTNAISQKIFEGERLIRSELTNLLQTVIFKSGI